jgi:EAL domain-containing protein (putative c-di-GMP-specific phosphodiesterase class I)
VCHFDPSAPIFGAEIAENAVMQNEATADNSLQQLHKLGLKISIDDFGAGYFSLDRLKRLALNAMKIDQSFVSNFPNNPDDRAIAASIIALAHTLGIKSIAKGVESEQQLEFLKNAGCERIQGYFFSRPLLPEQLVKLILNSTSDQPVSLETPAAQAFRIYAYT